MVVGGGNLYNVLSIAKVVDLECSLTLLPRAQLLVTVVSSSKVPLTEYIAVTNRNL